MIIVSYDIRTHELTLEIHSIFSRERGFEILEMARTYVLLYGTLRELDDMVLMITWALTDVLLSSVLFLCGVNA